MKNAAWFFDDGQPFLVHNVDALTDLDLNALMAFHRTSGALATLAAHQRPTSRYLLFDRRFHLCGWQSTRPEKIRMARPPDGGAAPWPFMGVQILSPEILDKITLTPPFSLIDLYLDLAATGETITGLPVHDARWMDVGRIEHLQRVDAVFDREYFESIPSTPRCRKPVRIPPELI